MSTLQKTIENQAVQFAEAIIQALRGASLDELVGIAGSGAARPAPRGAAPKAAAAAPAPKKAKGGRLGRRSAEDIANTLDQIVSLLAKHPDGLRSEQIQASLQLDKREMPKPIAEGLSSGALKKTGQKRATVYSVGSGGAKKRAKK